MYYVDLCSNALSSQEDSTAEAVASPDASASRAGPNDISCVAQTKKVQRVCHRKSMRGRTAIVFCVCEVIPPTYLIKSDDARAREEERQPVEEPLGTRAYSELKPTWRDLGEKLEGEGLEWLARIYGLGQHKWHGDAFKACGNSSYGGIVDWPDSTPSQDQVRATENMMDLDIGLPEEESKETQCKAPQTDEYPQGDVPRTSRIYCRLLPPTIGSPLCSAESPRQLLQAVLDVILSYWGLMNRGLFPPDINDGNVMILKEEQGYHKREWKALRSATRRLDLGVDGSEKLLREALDRLGRDPTGMLYGLDLFTTHDDIGAGFFEDLSREGDEREADEPEAKRRKLNSGTAAPIALSSDQGQEQGIPGGSSLTCAVKVDQEACRVVDFRTRTPSFLSTRALHEVSSQRYAHHFTDDLESFFWLMLWCVAEHVDSEDSHPTEGALDLLDSLNRSSLRDIATAKSCLLGKSSRKGIWMRKILASCNNGWAGDSAIIKVVLALGNYFFGIFIDESFLECNPSEVFPALVEIILDAIST
ncbi:hypothetical protein FS749_002646 [Ceratobasidium sp. UAMH 11750]|nr:hypothetical protein FS749_002646 [Ceratobasidium sp. UAMH 11750]